jgi:hypothetical protein
MNEASPLKLEKLNKASLIALILELHEIIAVQAAHIPALEDHLGHEKRQVFDVPSVQVEITEHQADIKSCPQCGEWIIATFLPAIIQAVQYGPGLQSQAVYLTQHQLLPLAHDFYGHRPSEALFLVANDGVAELDLRLMKVKQKISGAFRTPTGTALFCAIRTYLTTARKQGQSALQVICDPLQGRPFIPNTT